VRYNEHTTRRRAWGCCLGTVGGAALAVLALGVAGNLTILIHSSVLFAALNGLFKARKIGQIPFFYTATVILLYCSFDISSGPRVAAQRVLHNVVRIAIGLLVVLYPFPALMRRLRLVPETHNVLMLSERHTGHGGSDRLAPRPSGRHR
jgi:uncharacterized membrane protein YgaE (UPF0421/DUF939 family)